MEATKERVHALDGLRALAVALVFAYHVVGGQLARSLSERGHDVAARFVGSLGASGVELFFCLSGVVLLRPYLKLGRPMDVRKYLWRRLVRLYPPFAGAWVLAGLTVWFVGRYTTWWTVTSQMPRFDALDLLAEIGLGIGSNSRYNWAWWSLAPEVLFYLLVPVLVLGMQRARDPSRAASFLLVLCTLLSLSAFGVEPRAGHGRLVWMLGHYAVCFAVGTLLASRPLASWERRCSVLVAILLFAGAAISERVNLHAAYALLFLPLVDRCLRTGSAVARQFSRHWLVWLGERSYSIFLIHFSAIQLACLFASAYFPKGTGYVLVSRSLSIAMTLALACALFEFVERRFATGLTTGNQWFPWSLQRRLRAAATAQVEVLGPG
jgi:peptidoglycan/LPS O-acetylase OafA/YrhL